MSITEKAEYTQINIVIEYENGGKIGVYLGVDKEAGDHDKIKAACDYFAKQGKETIMTPRVHHKDPLYKEVYQDIIGTKYEGMCPDFKVGDIFYEHEGFDVKMNSDPKRTFKNMISRGTKQSKYIVIEDCGVGRYWAQRNVYERVKNGADIKEVWIREADNALTRLF